MENIKNIEAVILKREVQGNDIVVLEIGAVSGALPVFEAGAHVDVHVGNNLVRQYSLCGNPRYNESYRLGVLRDPKSRGGSESVFESLHQGVHLKISSPKNHFPLSRDARHTILVGGGIGITPMIAMAYELDAVGASFELHYCARSRESCGFLSELENSGFSQCVTLHLDNEGTTQRLDVAARIASVGTVDTHLYVCGPTGFMEWVISNATDSGLNPAQIHREYFSTTVDSTGQSFEVVAANSGKTVKVQEGQTIVSALASIGVNVDVSCGEGVCGTCLCIVLEGECDHRDVYLTPEERAANDQILVCCSRAKSQRLVLDV